jgi:hypothetical protein
LILDKRNETTRLILLFIAIYCNRTLWNAVAALGAAAKKRPLALPSNVNCDLRRCGNRELGHLRRRGSHVIWEASGRFFEKKLRKKLL